MAALKFLDSVNKRVLGLENFLLSRVITRICGPMNRKLDDLDLAYDVSPVDLRVCDEIPLDCDDAKSGVAGLFDSLLWAAVPKSRRSRERTTTRKFGVHKIREYMSPKRSIIACLDCGYYHEPHTLCGHCYKKVKEETEVMRNKMDQNTRFYSGSQAEVVCLYNGERIDKNGLQGSCIAEMKKTRPEWFPKKF